MKHKTKHKNLKDIGKLQIVRARARYAQFCAEFNYSIGSQDAWDKIVEILGA